MKKLLAFVLLCAMTMSIPVQAEEAAGSAETEVQVEGNIFSRAWTSVKNFFAGEEEVSVAESEETAPVAEQSSTEADAQVEAGVEAEVEADGSLVDKAAESTKAGVDWTADKAKKGAEWTKETAKDVTQATGKGVKKVGAAIEGLFPNANDTQVDAEASVEAGVED